MTVLVFVLLVAQLWRIQVIQGDALRARADQNRFRLVEVKGPRGVIYDRNGRILVRNRPSFSIAAIPADLPDDEDETRQVLEELDRVLDATQEQIGLPIGGRNAPVEGASEIKPALLGVTGPPLLSQRLTVDQALEDVEAGWEGSAYRPIILASQVDREVAFAVAEDSHRLPGISLSIEPVREYFSSTLTSHVLGFMGPIPQAYVDDYLAEGYEAYDQVGLAGLELTYEKALRGRDGQRNIEVDVNGREVRTVGDIFPSAPGNNLVLSLDLDLQRITDEALRKGMQQAKAESGVAIAMNPQNGEILAMVSLPTYDNNLFAKGITPTAYSALLNDKHRPLVNHAISGLYPPGSTFKIVTASGALQEGVIDERTRLGDSFDGAVDGKIWVDNRFFPDDPRYAQPFYCWIHSYGAGHYMVNVREALAVSCDVFFYQVSGGYRKTFEGLGIDKLVEYTEHFGFGSQAGVDLPGENPGLVPTPRWKRLTYAETWSAGDTYNMSIGQGAILATPLQVLNSTAAIANGGLLYQPRLVQKIVDTEGNLVEQFQAQLIRELPVDPEYINLVREGMWAAVNFPNGTAKALVVPGVSVAAKTGTAEFFDPEIGYTPSGRLPTHAWFTAFAPYEDPEIVLAVFVYNGGEGSTTALPIAQDILRGYFDLKQQRAAAESGTPAAPTLEEMPTEQPAALPIDVPAQPVEQLPATPPSEAGG
jgi:penicillin-binding protein 2